MISNSEQELQKKFINKTLTDTMQESESICPLTAFLASDLSKCFNGQIIDGINIL